ncbi:MAG TPA: hypothetical protein VFG20_10210 [Planctomycetaceae bacterium]|nr:hypothetical protein [Planctomycetaceae bacterium]
MSDPSASVDSTAPRPDESLALGNDLPPVEPPSAGFIIQLFVVPAIIVLAVVAVWALFGRLAAGEADWRALVQDLESANPHVYKRAMFGLAQLLDNDRRLGENGQHLAQNPEISTALSKLLNKQLDGTSQDDETVTFEVYLTRAIGLLDQADPTLPALHRALDARYDAEVRKGAVTSMALIASRVPEIAAAVEAPAVDAVVALSQDPNALLRRAGAFTLGLLPKRADGPAAAERMQRLTVMLNDDDWMTAVNAAISLARWKSTAGFPVFVKACETAVNPADVAAVQDDLTVLRNVLRAIGELGPHWDDAQRAALRKALQHVIDTHADQRIKVDAQTAFTSLQ